MELEVEVKYVNLGTEDEPKPAHVLVVNKPEEWDRAAGTGKP